MTHFRKLVTASIFAILASGAHAATLGVGESADFRFDLSTLGDVGLRGYGASCASDASCVLGGLVMLQVGGGLNYEIGLARGASDIFEDTLFPPRGQDAISISDSISPTIAIAASVQELFVRVTAFNETAIVGSTNLSFDGANPATLFGTELAPAAVPTPGALGGMMTALAAFVFMRRRAARG